LLPWLLLLLLFPVLPLLLFRQWRRLLYFLAGLLHFLLLL
jgi:hypothetical protein